MKKIKEMNLQELADEMNVYTNMFPHIGLVVDRIRELNERGRWIPINERMPSEDDGRYVLARFFDGDLEVVHNAIARADDSITHWRRIDI